MITVDEFKKLSDEVLVLLNISKKELAQKLLIEPSYFSKLYTGKKPIASHVFERLKSIKLQNGSIEKPPPTREDKVWEAIHSIQREIADIKGRLIQIMLDNRETIERLGSLRGETALRLDEGEKKISELVERADELGSTVYGIAHSSSRKAKNS